MAKVCVLDENGNETYEGRRCVPYSYTGKTLLSITDYKKKMQDEIRRVKNLKGKLPPWYIDRRPKNAFWDDDPVSRLPGVGKKTAASLIAIDICKIGDLKLLSEVDLCDFAAMSNDPNLTTMKLKYFIEKAHESLEGSGQDLIEDYRKEDNPYEARFGDDWLIELKKVQLMQPYVCITQMIQHIVDASKKVMKGTKYEGKELFFHDALSLMTAKETVRWMKEKDLYKHWILPALGLNDRVGMNKNSYAN